LEGHPRGRRHAARNSGGSAYGRLLPILLKGEGDDVARVVDLNAAAFFIDIEDFDIAFALANAKDERMLTGSRFAGFGRGGRGLHDGFLTSENTASEDASQGDVGGWRFIGLRIGRRRRRFKAENVAVHDSLVRSCGGVRRHRVSGCANRQPSRDAHHRLFTLLHTNSICVERLNTSTK
jgi:hypothetical protein